MDEKGCFGCLKLFISMVFSLIIVASVVFGFCQVIGYTLDNGIVESEVNIYCEGLGETIVDETTNGYFGVNFGGIFDDCSDCGDFIYMNATNISLNKWGWRNITSLSGTQINENISLDNSLCDVNLVNSSWSDWLNISCLSSDLMNQSRSLVEYDENNCGLVENRTIIEYRNTLECDFCTPGLVNSSWSSWLNISCLESDVMNQSRSLTQYDPNNCGEVENKTFVEYRNTEFCDYCVPGLVNITGDWVNISCLSSDVMNQSREIIQYDINYCGEVGNQTFVEYRSELGCDYCLPDWFEINTSCRIDDAIIGYYNDSNNCYEQTGLESDNNAPLNNTYSCNYCSEDINGPFFTACNSSDRRMRYYQDNNYSVCCSVTGLESDCGIDNGSYESGVFACDFDGAPGISFTSPENGSVFYESEVYVWIETSGATNVWYDYGQGDMVYTDHGLVSFPDGIIDLQAWANDSYGNVNTSLVSFEVDTVFPPNAVSGLRNISNGKRWIYWNWTEPQDADFLEAIIYIDGVNTANVSVNYYNASVRPGEHIITVHTKDVKGNVNTTNVSNTAKTVRFCGDNICQLAENTSNCPRDCGYGFEYNESIKIGNNTLNISVNGSKNISDFYNWTQKIEIKLNQSSIIDLIHNFSEKLLDLRNMSIVINQSDDKEYMIVKNVNISFNKTVYIEKRLDSSNGVCVSDSEIEDLDELESTCVEMECPGEMNEWICELISGRFKVSGLRHSGVIETYINGGDPPGPPGGGGSSGRRTVYQCNDRIDNDLDGLVDYPNDPGCESIIDNDETDEKCVEDWICGEWKPEVCSVEGVQTRECGDFNKCGTTVLKPAEERECVSGERLSEEVEPDLVEDEEGLEGITGLAALGDVVLSNKEKIIGIILLIFAVLLSVLVIMRHRKEY